MIDPESGVISVAEDGDLSIEESGELYDMEVKVRILSILITQHLNQKDYKQLKEEKLFCTHFSTEKCIKIPFLLMVLLGFMRLNDHQPYKSL